MGNIFTSELPPFSSPDILGKLSPDTLDKLIRDVIGEKWVLYVEDICDVRDGYTSCLSTCNEQIYMISREGTCRNDSAHIQYPDQDTMINVICKSKCSDAECVGLCACLYEVRWDIPQHIDPSLIRSIILNIQKMGAIKVIIVYEIDLLYIDLMLVRYENSESYTDPKTYNFRTDRTPSYILALFNMAQRLGG